MFWWVVIVIAVVVIGLALLWFRGRRSGRSSTVDPNAVARTRRDGQARGFGSGGF